MAPSDENIDYGYCASIIAAISAPRCEVRYGEVTPDWCQTHIIASLGERYYSRHDSEKRYPYRRDLGPPDLKVWQRWGMGASDRTEDSLQTMIDYLVEIPNISMWCRLIVTFNEPSGFTVTLYGLLPPNLLDKSTGKITCSE